MSFFNQTEDTIIDILNSKNIDRISMAGIIGTLRQENLSENSFLNFIRNKEDLSIEDCTEQIWEDIKKQAYEACFFNLYGFTIFNNLYHFLNHFLEIE